MKTLKQLREEIEKIDEGIIQQLALRKELSLQIGGLKKQLKKKINDTAREKTLKHYHATLAVKHTLDARFIRRIFKVILRHSRKLQKKTTVS